MRTSVVLVACLALFTAEAVAKKPRKAAGIQKTAAYKNAVRESIERAMAMYPDYDTKGTSLNRAIQEEIQRQTEINLHYFDNTDWPERIARACAAVLGIDPARPRQAAQ